MQPPPQITKSMLLTALLKFSVYSNGNVGAGQPPPPLPKNTPPEGAVNVLLQQVAGVKVYGVTLPENDSVIVIPFTV